MRNLEFLAPTVLALLICAGTTFAQTDTNTTTQPDKPLDPDAAKRWQELHDQNLILEEKQKQTTDQQNLFKSFLPALPQGTTPGLERKGALSIKGTAAAYDSLKILSERFARNIAGGQPVTENCSGMKAKPKEECESRNSQNMKDNPKKSYTAIWLHGEREAGAMAQLPVFESQLRTFVCQLALKAQENVDDCKQAPVKPNPVLPHAALIAPAAIAPLVQTALGIFELFRTSTTITSTSIPTDEVSFTAMVAGELRKLRPADDIYYPSVFPLPINNSQLLTNVETLRGLVEKLTQQLGDEKEQQAKQAKATVKADAAVTTLKTQIETATDRINELDERIAVTVDKEQRAFWQLRRTDATTAMAALQKRLDEEAQPAADAADAANEDLSASVKELQDLIDKAIAFQSSLYEKVDDDTLLSKILRLESAAEQWKLCPAPTAAKRCAALQLTVVSAGAEMKTSQNYWAVGESVGGGAVASYLLYDPRTGSVLDAGSDSSFESHKEQ
jgi:hypothetical protein